MTVATGRRHGGGPAGRKRAAVVRAARERFLRDGFGVTVEAIAGHARVSKATVYSHFGTKEELFAEVVGEAVEEACREPFETMREFVRRAPDVRGALTAAARAWVDGLARPDVLALRALVAAESARFPELAGVWRTYGPDRLAAALAELLRGDPRLDVPNVDVAVLQFHALVLYPHFAHGGYPAPLDPETADELIARGVEMFLAYYGRDGR
ncbi:TetR/AcrR family transcriptional regulator [Yinghuangia aomiensis]|uniref:TetR/AcrR family transcriptional regulator n=1 Tax=Yinghuangia aomiensis TaxID=676205 RepID=A0ABP9H8K7_9ACTN